MKSNESLYRTAHHESAHCILAYCFRNLMTIKTITIDKEYANILLNDENDEIEAGINIISNTDVEWNIFNQNKLERRVRLVVWAGAVADTILRDGFDNFVKNLYDYKNNIITIEESFATGDKLIMKDIGNKGFNLKDIMKLSQERDRNIIIDFFSKTKIWEITQELSVSILNSEKMTLTEEEINEILSKHDKILIDNFRI